MEKSGKNFIDVLNDAKKLGFAENKPISDLDGSDAAAKIKILSSLAFNKSISKNKILTEGIESINQTDIYHAKNLGYKIKLLALSEIINNKLMERVHPCLVQNSSYIANINDVSKQADLLKLRYPQIDEIKELQKNAEYLLS